MAKIEKWNLPSINELKDDPVTVIIVPNTLRPVLEGLLEPLTYKGHHLQDTNSYQNGIEWFNHFSEHLYYNMHTLIRIAEAIEALVNLHSETGGNGNTGSGDLGASMDGIKNAISNLSSIVKEMEMNITQTQTNNCGCCGNSGNNGNNSNSNDNSNTGNQQVTQQLPLELPLNGLPDGFTELTEYEEFKCKAANKIFDTLLGYINGVNIISSGGNILNLPFIMAQLFMLFPNALRDGISLSEIGALILQAITEGAVTPENKVFRLVRDKLTEQRPDIVCGLYKSTTTVIALNFLIDGIDDLIVTLAFKSSAAFIVKALARQVITTNLVNDLFRYSANLGGVEIVTPCISCGTTDGGVDGGEVPCYTLKGYSDTAGVATYAGKEGDLDVWTLVPGESTDGTKYLSIVAMDSLGKRIAYQVSDVHATVIDATGFDIEFYSTNDIYKSVYTLPECTGGVRITEPAGYTGEWSAVIKVDPTAMNECQGCTETTPPDNGTEPPAGWVLPSQYELVTQIDGFTPADMNSAIALPRLLKYDSFLDQANAIEFSSTGQDWLIFKLKYSQTFTSNTTAQPRYTCKGYLAGGGDISKITVIDTTGKRWPRAGVISPFSTSGTWEIVENTLLDSAQSPVTFDTIEVEVKHSKALSRLSHFLGTIMIKQP